MKIEFKKISSNPIPLDFNIQSMNLRGEVCRCGSLFRFDGKLSGEMELICDLSGEPYMYSVDEDLVLQISDGICDVQSQNSLDDFDIIEFFDGFIDFGYILESEMDSIRMGYHTNITKQGDYYGSSKEES